MGKFSFPQTETLEGPLKVSVSQTVTLIGAPKVTVLRTETLRRSPKVPGRAPGTLGGPPKVSGRAPETLRKRRRPAATAACRAAQTAYRAAEAACRAAGAACRAAEAACCAAGAACCAAEPRSGGGLPRSGGGLLRSGCGLLRSAAALRRRHAAMRLQPDTQWLWPAAQQKLRSPGGSGQPRNGCGPIMGGGREFPWGADFAPPTLRGILWNTDSPQDSGSHTFLGWEASVWAEAHAPVQQPVQVKTKAPSTPVEHQSPPPEMRRGPSAHRDQLRAPAPPRAARGGRHEHCGARLGFQLQDAVLNYLLRGGHLANTA
eukprot:gene15749-biopygen264